MGCGPPVLGELPGRDAAEVPLEPAVVQHVLEARVLLHGRRDARLEVVAPPSQSTLATGVRERRLRPGSGPTLRRAASRGSGGTARSRSALRRASARRCQRTLRCWPDTSVRRIVEAVVIGGPVVALRLLVGEQVRPDRARHAARTTAAPCAGARSRTGRRPRRAGGPPGGALEGIPVATGRARPTMSPAVALTAVAARRIETQVGRRRHPTPAKRGRRLMASSSSVKSSAVSCCARHSRA